MNQSLPPIPRVTRIYLEQGCSEGERNHTLFHATCQLRDARWPEEIIYNVLIRRAMLDGLHEREARTTIDSALKGNARESITKPSNAAGTAPASRYTLEREYAREEPMEEKAKPVRYPLDESEDLPEPMDNPTERFLKVLYKDNDKIQLVVAELNEDGGESPTGNAVILPVKSWLEKIREKGTVSEIFASYDEGGKRVEKGMYFSINPLKEVKDGRKMANIARYDYALIEFDTISLKQQWQLIRMSKIPAATVSYSGGKSIHALVRVDARSKEEYAARVKKLMDHFSEYDVDTQNKDPSRLSRIPGPTRADTGKGQTLLAVNIGCESWEDWMDSLEDTFPDILTQEEFYNEEITRPPAIIDGLLDRQMSMVLGGSSKTYKSWTLLDMAVSVANGLPFWGIPVTRGKVLYINFEIQKYYMRERVKKVCKAKQCELPTDNLYIWNLRGKAQALEAIRPKFTRVMVNAGFSMVILDPIYKTLGDRDENAAGDINSLMNEMESLAVETGAAVVFATHFSKGNQSSKNPLDRVSGSGVFARSPDTIMVMTEHEEDGCYTVEATVRNHETPRPFVVRMAFPLFERQERLDPAKLKGPSTVAETRHNDVLKSIIFMLDSATWRPQSEVINALKEDGVTETTVKRIIAQAVQDKKIIREIDPKDSRQKRLRRDPSIRIVF
jgi:RecA-family ATPase